MRDLGDSIDGAFKFELELLDVIEGMGWILDGMDGIRSGGSEYFVVQSVQDFAQVRILVSGELTIEIVEHGLSCLEGLILPDLGSDIFREHVH